MPLENQPNDLNHNDLNVVALVSVGRHPQSGRERRAEQDSRAVELGLRLAADRPVVQLDVLHAGDPQQPVLRHYAGMGLDKLQVLQMRADGDAVAPLRQYLEENPADIVLTGMRAESGESSGMLPYQLAEQLGWPIVPGVADIIGIEDGVADLLQALPRGQRRAIKVALPFVATIDNAAQPARQSAYGPANRALIEAQPVSAPIDAAQATWQESPARKRPKRLKVVKAKTAAERFKAATAKSQSAGGKVLQNESPAQQAQVIFDLLLEEGVIK